MLVFYPKPGQGQRIARERSIPTIDVQFRNQTKPGCCFACYKSGHWRAQCPLLAEMSCPGQWLADPEQGQDQGVVFSNFRNAFPSSLDGVGNGLEDDLIDSDYSSSFVTVKSLTLSEFDACQCKVCSVCGNLAKCYQEWEKIGASGFILSVIRNGYKIPFIDFPPPKVFPNNALALKEKCFVSQVISDIDLLVTRRVFGSLLPTCYSQPTFSFYSVFRQEKVNFGFETC